MSGQMKSMPATSSPTIWAAVSAISTLSGCASIVRSIDVPPVDMLPVRASLTQVPAGRTSSSSKPWSRTSSSAASSTLIRVSTFSWPMPRRGSALAMSTSCADGVLAVAGDATPGRARRSPRPCRRSRGSGSRCRRRTSRRRRRPTRLSRERAVERRADGLLGAQVEVDAAAVVAVERLDHAREAEPLRGGDGRRPPSSTTSARGTGRPAESSSRLVRLLSDATSTPIAEVCEVIVARIRCWWTPWPNWTSEWRSSRMNGMSRLTASSMSACVDGPNACRSASRMSRSSSGAKSKKTSGSSGATRWLTRRDGHPAGLEADLPPRGTRRCSCTGRRGPAARVLPWRTSVPARFWNSSAMCSAMWPDPRAVPQPRDEAAAPAERAGVVLEGRQQRDERVGEARDLVRRELLEHAEVDEQPDDRLAGPVVRAAQDARLEDAQRRRGPLGAAPSARGATVALARGSAGRGLGHVAPPASAGGDRPAGG